MSTFAVLTIVQVAPVLSVFDVYLPELAVLTIAKVPAQHEEESCMNDSKRIFCQPDMDLCIFLQSWNFLWLSYLASDRNNHMHILIISNPFICFLSKSTLSSAWEFSLS